MSRLELHTMIIFELRSDVCTLTHVMATAPHYFFDGAYIEIGVQQMGTPWKYFVLTPVRGSAIRLTILQATGDASTRMLRTAFLENTPYTIHCETDLGVLSAVGTIGVVNMHHPVIHLAIRSETESLIHFDIIKAGTQRLFFVMDDIGTQTPADSTTEAMGIYKGPLKPKRITYGDAYSNDIEYQTMTKPVLASQSQANFVFSWNTLPQLEMMTPTLRNENDEVMSIIGNAFAGPTITVLKNQPNFTRGSRLKRVVDYRGFIISSNLSDPLSFTLTENPVIGISHNEIGISFQNNIIPNISFTAVSPKQELPLNRQNATSWLIAGPIIPATFEFRMVIDDKFWTSNIILPHRSFVPVLSIIRAFNGQLAVPQSSSMFQLVGLGSEHGFRFATNGNALTPRENNLFITPQPTTTIDIVDQFNSVVQQLQVVSVVRPAPIILSRDSSSLIVDPNMQGEEFSSYIDQNGNHVLPSDLSSFHSNTVSISTQSTLGVNSAPLNLLLGNATLACEYDGTKTTVRIQPPTFDPTGLVLMMVGNGVTHTTKTLEFPGKLSPGTYRISFERNPLFWTVTGATLVVRGPNTPEVSDSQTTTKIITQNTVVMMIIGLILVGSAS